jgi:hypothetical protein
MPCISHSHQNCNRDPAFNKNKFSYNKEQDCYFCPVGNQLKRIQFKRDKNATVYKADRKICQQCQHFQKCVTGKSSGRQIQRNTNEQYIEWADNCLPRYERKRLMARRKYKAEGSFADAANNHGFKRSRFRGIEKVRIQNLMIATIQNLRKLMSHICRKPAEESFNLARLVRLLADFCSYKLIYSIKSFLTII